MHKAPPLAAVVMVLCLLGCNRQEQAEARTMLVALELLEGADHEGRVRLLAALEETQATGEAAVAARNVCVEAYRALDEATEAAKALPDGGLPDALGSESLALLKTLRRADEQLKAANKLLPDCHAAIRQLRQQARR